MEIHLKFRLEKETPGALRYHEVDQRNDADLEIGKGAVVGTIYIRKDKIDGKPPYVYCVLSTEG